MLTWPRWARPGSVRGRALPTSATSPSPRASAPARIVERGRLLHGVRSLAEVGHTVIDWKAWERGAPGTLEELGSGSGLARLAHERGLGDLDARGVADAAAAGNEGAAAVWQGAIAAGAVAIANLVMTFYPSTVVIGGGIGRQPTSYFGPRSARTGPKSDSTITSTP